MMKSGDQIELEKTEKKVQFNGNAFFNNKDVAHEILSYLPIRPAYFHINKNITKTYETFLKTSIGEKFKKELERELKKKKLANNIIRLKERLDDNSISLEVPKNKEDEEKFKSEFKILRDKHSGCDLRDNVVNASVLMLAAVSILLLVVAGSHDSNMTISGSVLLLLAILTYCCYKSYRNHAFQEVSDVLAHPIYDGPLEKLSVQPTEISNEKDGDKEEKTSPTLSSILIHSLYRSDVPPLDAGNTATPLTPLLEKGEEEKKQNQNQCQQSMSSSRPYS